MISFPLDWTAIATIALAAATFALAWFTNRMARTTDQSFALESRPYLAHLECRFEASNAVVDGFLEVARLLLELAIRIAGVCTRDDSCTRPAKSKPDSQGTVRV